MPERRRSPLLIAAAGLLAAAVLSGCSTTPAATVQPAAPAATQSASAQPDTARAAGLQDPSGAEDEVSAASKRSAVPVRIVIPRIHVNASLLDLQRGPDGVLAAPPAGELEKAGWYAKGTVPGAVGPAVIAGHVDWVDRIAVFHRLDELREGDRIEIRMSDRSTVRFTVDRTRTVSKFRFPSAAVYGPTPDAQLRVITCGGPWDDARNIYSENVIVFASLSG